MILSGEDDTPAGSPVKEVRSHKLCNVYHTRHAVQFRYNTTNEALSGWHLCDVHSNGEGWLGSFLIVNFPDIEPPMVCSYYLHHLLLSLLPNGLTTLRL